MRESNFALRLQPSLLDEARKLAAEEGVALNQLINVAVAVKLSALRTERHVGGADALLRGAKGKRLLYRQSHQAPERLNSTCAPFLR